MPLTVSAYVAQLKRVKAYLEANPEASAELKASFAADGAAFKKAYTPDVLRQAMAANDQVASDLEEHVTSTIILMNDDRARRGASG